MVSGVLLVTNEYPPERIAGTAMSTQFLAEELSARGHQVTVVVNTRKTAPSQEVHENLNVFRLRPLPLPMTRMTQRAMMLLDVARRVRPNVIQGQSLSCGFLALVVGRALGIPTVTYVQGFDLYEAAAWARRTYIKWALTQSDCVATVTSDLRSKAFALSGRWGEVIPHGLRIREVHSLDQQVARSLLRLPAGAKIILYVGRLVPSKGVVYLIRALSRIVGQDPAARLVLVGGGEERGTLVELTRQLKLDQHVQFAGESSHEDVIRFMRASDIFVLPSLVEPFGIVLVEAMSCGLPIVASNVMGIPSIVEDGTNGCLVSPGDEMALADRIGRLLADPRERSSMGLKNTQKAAGYTLSQIADRFVKLWEDAVVSHSQGRSGMLA